MLVVHRPQKYEPGNTLIFDPSGRIHFVNLSTKEYYWTVPTNEASYTFVKDDDFDDYFGFKEEDNHLFYFTKSGHKVINCDHLTEIVADINKDRTDGVKFKVATPRDSTFWIDFFDGTVYWDEEEVGDKKLDTIEIQRRDYHIWHDDNNKKMELKFGRLIECVGPCVCKDAHVEDDYAELNLEFHEDLRDGNFYVLQFRDYVKLLDFEKKLFGSMPRLPKDDHPSN